MPADRFEQLVAELTDDELLALHRVACRRAAKIYGWRYAGRHAAGVNAARERQQAGYERHRARLAELATPADAL